MKNIEATIKSCIPQQLIKAAEKFESLVQGGPLHQQSIQYFKIQAKNHKKIKKQISMEPKVGLSELGHYQFSRKSMVNENSQSMIHCFQIHLPELHHKNIYIDDLTTIVSEQIEFTEYDSFMQIIE